MPVNGFKDVGLGSIQDEPCNIPHFTLAREQRDCPWKAKYLIRHASVGSCAAACETTPGCRFFSYWHETTDYPDQYLDTSLNYYGTCWHLITAYASCPEGIQMVSTSNIYQLSTCYKEKGQGGGPDVKTDDACSCHWSCASCGYGANPAGADACLTCADGSPVVPKGDGPEGTCPSSKCYVQDGSGIGGWVPLLDPHQACECHSSCQTCEGSDPPSADAPEGTGPEEDGPPSPRHRKWGMNGHLLPDFGPEHAGFVEIETEDLQLLPAPLQDPRATLF